jgi:geranylgeranyl pyrophosphate synthase
MPLSNARSRIDSELAALCANELDGVAGNLVEPVRYALAGEGKRLRPILAQLVHEACGGGDDIIPLAIAVEIIHTYSLVHDDLPCMDDDNVRRGQPTLHKKFSQREAIFAGAALIPIAARTVFRAGKKLGYDDAKCSAICRALLRGAGAEGMIGGQLQDLGAEGRTLALEEMESVHSAKTGELILASARIGAVSADASPEALRAVEKYARSLGLAFQIMDDVLDATATSTTIGKTAGRDAVLGKSTYVSVLGVAQARERADELVKEGMEALSERGILTLKLREVANFILARNF